MRKHMAMLAAVIATGLFAGTSASSSQNVVVREKLLSIALDANTVYAEAYYNGSSFSGGGIMSCIATYRVTVRNGGVIVDQYTELRNVSLSANWVSSNPAVYGYPDLNDYVYDAPAGSPDGLWIYGGDSATIGTTTVTVTFGGKTATGTITFWAD